MQPFSGLVVERQPLLARAAPCSPQPTTEVEEVRVGMSLYWEGCMGKKRTSSISKLLLTDGNCKQHVTDCTQGNTHTHGRYTHPRSLHTPTVITHTHGRYTHPWSLHTPMVVTHSVVGAVTWFKTQEMYKSHINYSIAYTKPQNKRCC